MRFTVNYSGVFTDGGGIYAIAHDFVLPNALADMCRIGSPLRGKLVIGVEYGKLLLVDESNGWIQPRLWTLEVENRTFSEVYDYSLLAYAHNSILFEGPDEGHKGVLRHLNGEIDRWWSTREGDMVIGNEYAWRFTYEFRELMHQLDGVYGGPTNDTTDVIRIKDTTGRLVTIEDNANRDCLVFTLFNENGDPLRIDAKHFFSLFLE